MNAEPRSRPVAADDDQEREAGPPVMGVMLIAAAVCLIVWVGIALALMTAIDKYAAWWVLR